MALAIIPANVKHRITTKGSSHVFMLECNEDHFIRALGELNIDLKHNIFISPSAKTLFQEITTAFKDYSKQLLSVTHNTKIMECITFIESQSCDYPELIPLLKERVFLSESRISHLFKQEMGVSIKKYYVWSKLKKAFLGVIFEDKNMFEASLDAGFYDQAHLSKAFKDIFGLSPSTTYNSRILQE